MRRLRIRFGAFALDTTFYFFRHRGRIFARPLSRVRITVYHLRLIFIYLTTNYICNIICIVTIKVTITRKRSKTANVRKNTRNSKSLKDFFHITHLFKLLTTNTIAKTFNARVTLCKNRLTHKNLQKNAREKERKDERRNLPTGKTHLIRRSIGRTIDNHDMLNRRHNAFEFIPICNMNQLKISGMAANESLLVIEEVTERTNCLLRTTEETRSTIRICLKVADYTENLIHKSLEFCGLGKIP